jgi:8-amino-7-oxononanoate synthase
MFQLTHTTGRTTIVDEKEFLFFSGYAYLGINHTPAFLQLIKEGIDTHGLLFPSSRISNTQLSLYAEAEQYLSALTNTNETVLFASGYAAGTAATSLFTENIFYSPYCHPAIKKTETVATSFAHWAESITTLLNQNSSNITPAIIVSDAVNPITAEVYDFSFLTQIQQPIICIIDDSHGIGLLGDNGSGSYLPRKENITYLITYSLSKALNLQGGAVSCTNKTLAAKLRQHTMYTTSTPMPPAMLYAFLQAKNIYNIQRKKLQENTAYLQQLLQHKPIQHNPQLPIFILPQHVDEAYFAKHNIIISSFAYPTVDGEKVNRIVVNALHTKEDLEQVAMACLQAIT